MKFSALNVDFSDLSPDPLGSRRSAHVGNKEEYPLKCRYFTVSCLSGVCCLSREALVTSF